MAKITMKTYSLEEMEDKFIGKKGTTARDQYESELKKKILTHKAAKSAPKMRNRPTKND